MKSFLATVSLLASASAVLATPTPTPTIQKRADTCGQWDTVATGPYKLAQDLWGESSATSGEQCSGVEYLNSDNAIGWHTEWTWAGTPNGVKSYANVLADFTSKELASYSSIYSYWQWTYGGENIVADVSYDIFLGWAPSDSASYEIMIWLDALGGAGPISSSGSPIATPNIAGYDWKLYSGPNGDTTVYSFVATNSISNFGGDLMQFFRFLMDNEGLSQWLYIQSVGAGTEAFTGSNGYFVTSAYGINFD